MRECLSCVKSCKFNAITINDDYVCLKIDDAKPISIDPEICTDCGLCKKNCLIGDISMSAMDCMFCIVCSGKPHCIIDSAENVSLGKFLSAIFKVISMKFGRR